MWEVALRELHLFAGVGGGILGGQLLGHRCVCAVECEPYAQAVLVARQNDGTFPPFPIWDDVRTFDGKPWRGIVDVVAGGFPCQDISVAGKGAGIDGIRSGLWSEMARIIGEVRPRYAFVENSPALLTRGLDRVLCDLAEMGFDATWGCLSAADVGAPHKRERIWILGHAISDRCDTRGNHHGEDDGPKPSANDQYADTMAHTNVEQSHRGGTRAEQKRVAKSTDYGDDLPDPISDGLQGQSISITSGTESGTIKPWRSPSRISGAQLREWPADPADAPESGMGRVADELAGRNDIFGADK